MTNNHEIFIGAISQTWCNTKSPFGRTHALFSYIGAVFPLPPLSCNIFTGAVKGKYYLYLPYIGRLAGPILVL